MADNGKKEKKDKKDKKRRIVGNVEKRGENSYRLKVSDGFKEDGTRHFIQKTIKAKNDKDAEKQLATLIRDLEKGEYLEPSKLTFKEFALENWLTSQGKKG